MKFYNPFKAHVIELANGTFYVRQFGIFGWQYLDRRDNYWWTRTNNWNYYDTLESAIKRRGYNPTKILKVYQ
jgi:hypothetical protein